VGTCSVGGVDARPPMRGNAGCGEKDAFGRRAVGLLFTCRSGADGGGCVPSPGRGWVCGGNA
jgi:hypothetical protein